MELEVLWRKNKYFADFHKKSFLKWCFVRQKVRAAEAFYPVIDGFPCHLPIVALKAGNNGKYSKSMN